MHSTLSITLLQFNMVKSGTQSFMNDTIVVGALQKRNLEINDGLVRLQNLVQATSFYVKRNVICVRETK